MRIELSDKNTIKAIDIANKCNMSANEIVNRVFESVEVFEIEQLIVFERLKGEAAAIAPPDQLLSKPPKIRKISRMKYRG